MGLRTPSAAMTCGVRVMLLEKQRNHLHVVDIQRLCKRRFPIFLSIGLDWIWFGGRVTSKVAKEAAADNNLFPRSPNRRSIITSQLNFYSSLQTLEHTHLFYSALFTNFSAFVVHWPLSGPPNRPISCPICFYLGQWQDTIS